MSILNALKTSALTVVATSLFAGTAQAAVFSGAVSNESPYDSITDLEAALGVSLDGTFDPFNAASGNFETFTFDANAGDVLEFDSRFFTQESRIGAVNADFAFAVFNGEAVPLFDSTDGNGATGTQQFTVTNSGSNNFSVAVVNATRRTVIPSFPISIYDGEFSKITFSADLQGGNPPIAVPEPASMLALMAITALGGSSLVKRQQS